MNKPIFHICVNCGNLPSNRRIDLINAIKHQLSEIDYVHFIVTGTDVTITKLDTKE